MAEITESAHIIFLPDVVSINPDLESIPGNRGEKRMMLKQEILKG